MSSVYNTLITQNMSVRKFHSKKLYDMKIIGLVKCDSCWNVHSVISIEGNGILLFLDSRLSFNYPLTSENMLEFT